MRKISPYPWLPLLIAGLLALFGCGTSADQQQFEREALRAPTGYTHTDANGQVVNKETDPDDWRISPMYQSFVQVQTPAYPNPTKNQRITINLLITGIQAVNGLIVYSRLQDGTLHLLDRYQGSPLSSGGAVALTITPSTLAPDGTNTYASAIGLRRIFIYDGSQNLITYGDIKVE